MVAAATLLLNTTKTTRALISSIYNNDWQQQHCCCEKIKNIFVAKQANKTTMRNSVELNGDTQKQQQSGVEEHQNGKADIEEIDCKALLDSYEGETSNNSSDWRLFRWTPESTRLMLRLRFERQLEFQLRNRQKKDLWAEIANEMRKEGNYHTTGEVCDLKYRNMLQTYKKNFIKEERGMQSQIVWEYYDLFKEAMKACAAAGDDLVPSQLCDTICENDDDLMEVKTELGAQTEDYTSLPESAETTKETNTTTVDEELEMPNNNTTKRRMPSARVLANNSNNKRTRLSSMNSQSEPTVSAAAPVCTEFDWSRLPPLEPKPNTTAVTRIPISPPQPQVTFTPAHLATQQQIQVPTAHNSNYPMAPPWLTDSELREYFSYGESVGLQIAHIRDPRTRAFLQLKIQETLFLAKVDKLTE